MLNIPLADPTFRDLRDYIYEKCGIYIADNKKYLIENRLSRILQEKNLKSFEDYLKLIKFSLNGNELSRLFDAVTTNETYFFREVQQLDMFVNGIANKLLEQKKGAKTLKIWSAACSTGEEPYSVAMLLAEHAADRRWEILASDISTRVLDQARSGLYALDSVRGMTPERLKAHCLKGTGAHEGRFLVDPVLQRRVQFSQINLNEALPDVGLFDVIFLRNVLIYFDATTKQAVVGRLQQKLRPDGVLYIGHSESLNGLVPGLRMVAPSIYRKA